jgi:hypothetical protein
MKNKILILLCAFGSFHSFAQHDHHNQPAKTESSKPKSPRTSNMAMIGSNHVHIDYGSPSVRGRIIWNGLVAYGQVWATGAHKATWIEFSEDVIINKQRIGKGKYGLFTIPDKNEWTLILSKDWDMHLADDYNPNNDVLRLKIKPKMHKNLVEALQFKVIDAGKGRGKVDFNWEYLNLTFDFENAGK